MTTVARRMRVEPNCVVCMVEFTEEEPDVSGSLHHSDEVIPEGQRVRHTVRGIHQSCLRNWVTQRFIEDQPISCPLACPDKTVRIEPTLTMVDSYVQRFWRFSHRVFAPGLTREILIAAVGTGVVVGTILGSGSALLANAIGTPGSKTKNAILVGALFLNSSIGTMGGLVAGAIRSQRGVLGLEQTNIPEVVLIATLAATMLGEVSAYYLLT